MIKMISRLKTILFLLVMAALCGGYAMGADVYTVKIEDNIKLTGNLEAKVYKNASQVSLPDGTYIE